MKNFSPKSNKTRKGTDMKFFAKKQALSRTTDKRLHFTLDDKMYETIQDLAEANHRSVCGQIKYMVFNYLEGERTHAI